MPEFAPGPEISYGSTGGNGGGSGANIALVCDDTSSLDENDIQDMVNYSPSPEIKAVQTTLVEVEPQISDSPNLAERHLSLNRFFQPRPEHPPLVSHNIAESSIPQTSVEFNEATPKIAGQILSQALPGFHNTPPKLINIEYVENLEATDYRSNPEHLIRDTLDPKCHWLKNMFLGKKGDYRLVKFYDKQHIIDYNCTDKIYLGSLRKGDIINNVIPVPSNLAHLYPKVGPDKLTHGIELGFPKFAREYIKENNIHIQIDRKDAQTYKSLSTLKKVDHIFIPIKEVHTTAKACYSQGTLPDVGQKYKGYGNELPFPKNHDCH